MALFPPTTIARARQAADTIADRIDKAPMTVETAGILGALRSAVGALETALAADFDQDPDLGFLIVHDTLALQSLAADIESLANSAPALTWPLVQGQPIGGDLAVIRYILSTRSLP